jgi:hypothetical protein
MHPVQTACFCSLWVTSSAKVTLAANCSPSGRLWLREPMCEFCFHTFCTQKLGVNCYKQFNTGCIGLHLSSILVLKALQQESCSRAIIYAYIWSRVSTDILPTCVGLHFISHISALVASCQPHLVLFHCFLYKRRIFTQFHNYFLLQ